MLLYALIGLCLALVGVTGLMFTYVFYVDHLNRQRKAHLRNLENRCARLLIRLEAAEERLAEQEALLATVVSGAPEDAWAEVIDDG